MRQGPGCRVVGVPPTAEATREERLRWVRKFYRFNLATVVVVLIVALVGGGTFWWILTAAIAVTSAAGLTSISSESAESSQRRAERLPAYAFRRGASVRSSQRLEAKASV
jgi:hypothetical protein